MAAQNSGYTEHTLTIANTGTVSNALGAEELFGAVSISITAPGTLAETVTVKHVRPDGTYAKCQSPPGTDIVVAADSTMFITFGGRVPMRGLVLVAGTGVSGAKTFTVLVARQG